MGLKLLEFRWEVNETSVTDPVFFRVCVALLVSLLALAVITVSTSFGFFGLCRRCFQPYSMWMIAWKRLLIFWKFHVLCIDHYQRHHFLQNQVLDYIGDGDMTSDSVEKSLRQMIMALAILVGFSWEQAFDIAMLALSLHFPKSIANIAKAAITIVLVSIVAPAWKMYIIPTFLKLQEKHEEKREEVWDDYDAYVHKGREAHKFEAIDSDQYHKMQEQRAKARGIRAGDFFKALMWFQISFFRAWPFN